jgi:hypothetical protein
VSKYVAIYRSNGFYYATKQFEAETGFRAYAQALNWADLQNADYLIIDQFVKVDA